MTPLERAARAAQEADGAYRHESGQWMKEGGLVGDSHWQDIARAVLSAIREPSEGMVDRAFDLPPAIEGVDPKAAFTAMIDAALSENP